MKLRLNQIIAIVAGKKTKTQKLLTDVHHGWKGEQLMGISRTYQPKDEDGDEFPPQTKIVQTRVGEVLESIKKDLEDFYNTVASQEYANTEAKSNVTVDGTDILVDVPVSVLLFLEKQLVELRTLTKTLPVLPTDKEWSLDQNKNCYTTKPERTIKTQKKMKPIVKYHATPEHPAQTEMISEDETVGYWTTVHMSGAMPLKERNELVRRTEKLLEAVKIARENANSQEVVMQDKLGKSVLDYIFTSK